MESIVQCDHKTTGAGAREGVWGIEKMVAAVRG